MSNFQTYIHRDEAKRSLQQAMGLLQPEDFCALFPFNFGNFLKYALRAPFRGAYSPNVASSLDDYACALRSLERARRDLSTMPWFTEALIVYSPFASCFENQWVRKAMPVTATRIIDFDEAFASTAADLRQVINEGRDHQRELAKDRQHD